MEKILVPLICVVVALVATYNYGYSKGELAITTQQSQDNNDYINELQTSVDKIGVDYENSITNDSSDFITRMLRNTEASTSDTFICKSSSKTDGFTQISKYELEYIRQSITDAYSQITSLQKLVGTLTTLRGNQ